MKFLSLSLTLLLLSSCATAPKAIDPPVFILESHLQSRIQTLRPKASDFFFLPKNETDRSMYETGLYHHWQYYGKTPSPNSDEFLGYILLSDPYHRGLKRISFLLGTDCSNFVHRVFQMMGAEFRFMKTRHWIHLAKAKMSSHPKNYYSDQNKTNTPIDLKKCEWDQLMTQFELIREASKIQEGDVVVYPKSEGILGTKGHMGFVSKTHPVVVLQSKYKLGITEASLEPQEFYILRWKAELTPLKVTRFAALLDREYLESPAESCP